MKRMKVVGARVISRMRNSAAAKYFYCWVASLSAKHKHVDSLLVSLESELNRFAFVQDSNSTAFRFAIEQNLSIKQSYYVKLRARRSRMFCLVLHFLVFRRYCQTRRSLKYRLRHRGYVSLHSHFSVWLAVVNAFNIQRDDEFTISLLKSVSNFPLQHFNLRKFEQKKT